MLVLQISTISPILNLQLLQLSKPSTHAWSQAFMHAFMLSPRPDLYIEALASFTLYWCNTETWAVNLWEYSRGTVPVESLRLISLITRLFLSNNMLTIAIYSLIQMVVCISSVLLLQRTANGRPVVYHREAVPSIARLQFLSTLYLICCSYLLPVW